MPSWLPSIPYPPPDQPGFWQPHSATLQWCEEDYYATFYVAEIINTLTNSLFLYLSYKGVSSCLRHNHASVFVVAYVGYFLVGFGSWMFHTTLQYPWQLVDELNMIYTTCLMAYASFSYSRSVPFRGTLAISLITLCLAITLYYHHIQDPTFHQNVYAGMTLFIVLRSVYTMETLLRPSLQPKHHTRKTAHESARDADILKQMWILVVFGVTIFLSGFAIWGVDNVYCGTLRRWRRQVGLPWGILLEGHGWWHLMTGIGAYCYIVWGIHLRHVLEGEQERYRMVWPGWWTLPEIVRIEGAGKGKVNGQAVNGEAKKGR